MQRRRFVALAASTGLASVAGCFGTNTGPGREETNIEPGGNGPRTVSNELQNRLTVTDENLLTEDGQVSFSLRLENITEEPVTADVAVTMLNSNGDSVSGRYVERGVTVEAGDGRTVSFEVEESPDEVANYRVEVTEPDADDESNGQGEPASGEDEESNGQGEPASGEDDATTGAADEPDDSTP